jgi:VWFA-related protein
MKALKVGSHQKVATLSLTLLFFASTLLLANDQLVLARDGQAPPGELKGVTDVLVNPGFDDAKVSISVDGQTIADGLRYPYRVSLDLGAKAMEHKIAVTALTSDNKRVRWTETINKGFLPLTVHVTPVSLAERVFKATVTTPKNDPIASVVLWDQGKIVATADAPPYRFTVPESVLASQFVQVTAKTASGEEAADFWTSAGDVHVETVDVRTVPIYVSVVDDGNGSTRDDVDPALFHILDNGAEAKILELKKAFDQPISIALLIDASTSMFYTMHDASKAAQTFVQHTLKPGDRCAVYAIRDTPRREQPLTDDLGAVQKAILNLQARGRTSLYDAIETATRELRDEKNRRAIVILTDGGDTSSMASFDEVDKLSTEAGIPIYIIAYDSGSMEGDGKDLDRMKYLANQTGGFLVAANTENLQQKYGDIEKDLRAQYAILYQITDFAKKNEWRKIHVQLNAPKLTARTIRGYFAP